MFVWHSGHPLGSGHLAHISSRWPQGVTHLDRDHLILSGRDKLYKQNDFPISCTQDCAAHQRLDGLRKPKQSQPRLHSSEACTDIFARQGQQLVTSQKNNNITTSRLPNNQQRNHTLPYEMSNPPTPTLASLITSHIPSPSSLSMSTFGASSQVGYGGETPHMLRRAIMQGEDVPESPVIDRDAETDSPDVHGDHGVFAG